MSDSRGIVLLGGGGHCHALVDVLESCGIAIAGIVHGPASPLVPVMGYPPLGRDDDLPELRRRFSSAAIGVGQIVSAHPRTRLFAFLRSLDFEIPSIISPTAYLSRHSGVGMGTAVMHQALVNAGAHIGENCIINTRAIVEHDCHIGDNCHIAVNALLCGGVHIGDNSFIGAGAICRENVHIGHDSIIGCGCVIRSDISAGSLIKGEPA